MRKLATMRLQHAHLLALAAALLLALAVLACCLWDDLLSKRHLWLAAALLAAPIPPKRQPQTQPTPFP